MLQIIQISDNILLSSCINPIDSNFKLLVHRQTTTEDSKDKSPEWADLSHDIDVNNQPNVKRPTREESNDIELFVNDKYVPLNDVNDIKNVDFNEIETNDVYKRSVDNETDLEEDNEVYPIDDMDEIEMQEPINGNLFFYENLNVNDDDAPNVLDPDEDFAAAIDSMNGSSFLEELNKNLEVEGQEDKVKTRSKREILLPNANDLKNDTKVVDLDSSKQRMERQAIGDDTTVKAVPQSVVVEGIRVEESDKEPKIVDDGIPSVLADSSVTLRYV